MPAHEDAGVVREGAAGVGRDDVDDFFEGGEDVCFEGGEVGGDGCLVSGGSGSWLGIRLLGLWIVLAGHGGVVVVVVGASRVHLLLLLLLLLLL